MDVHSPEQRSFNMSKIKGRDTKPELMVRKWLWIRGYRYRLHDINLPGKPDIVFPGRKKVIFVHGCFWHRHGCQYFKWPKSNEEFWRNKIEGNTHRDQRHFSALLATDWGCLVIWECVFRGVKKNDLPEKLDLVGRLVEEFLTTDGSQCMEIDIHGIHQLTILT